VQKKGGVMMANHSVQLKATVAEVLWTTVLFVTVEKTQTSVINEAVVDGQSLWIDPVLMLVLGADPC
jgi:hypothetical protein